MELCRPNHAPLEGAARSHGGHSHGPGGHCGASSLDVEHRPKQRRALVLALWLTVGAMAVEVVGSVVTGSLMLLSDAAHMLSHAVALGVSYVALRLASRSADARAHYGLYRAEILAAFVNGIGVFVLCGWIAYEAIERFGSPEPILGLEMTLVAIFGLGVNLATALILGRAGAEDLNTKSAFVHMLGDTLSSVVIVLGGLVLWRTGWVWIDPALSLLVAAVVAVWGVRLVRDSVHVLLELCPRGMNPREIEAALLECLPGAHEIHDLHVWEITTGYVCLTAHVVVDDLPLSSTRELTSDAEERMREAFGIGHVTLQFESRGTEAQARDVG